VATEITFLDAEPQFGLFGLTFPACVDGKSVECLVTAEFLVSRFDAGDFTEDELRQTYQDHRAEIQKLVRAHIENGWIDEDGRVSLTKRFTRLTTTFSGRLEEFPGGWALVDSAHRILSGIIGPDAEAVSVEWNTNAGTTAHPVLNVRITDLTMKEPTPKRSVTESFDPKESANPLTLRLRLASLWSTILRGRSRQLSLLAEGSPAAGGHGN